MKQRQVSPKRCTFPHEGLRRMLLWAQWEDILYFGWIVCFYAVTQRRKGCRTSQLRYDSRRWRGAQIQGERALSWKKKPSFLGTTVFENGLGVTVGIVKIVEACIQTCPVQNPNLPCFATIPYAAYRLLPIYFIYSKIIRNDVQRIVKLTQYMLPGLPLIRDGDYLRSFHVDNEVDYALSAIHGYITGRHCRAMDAVQDIILRPDQLLRQREDSRSTDTLNRSDEVSWPSGYHFWPLPYFAMV